VLKSAIANAGEQEADTESLYVSKSYCNDGPIMKRFMPKDRGKSYRILKRTCHITVEVEEGTPPMTKAKRKQLEVRRDRQNKKKKAKTEGGTAAPGAETK